MAQSTQAASPQSAAALRYKAFEHFYGSPKDRKNGDLFALVASGLYSQTERTWAKNTGSPTDEQIAQFHEMLSKGNFFAGFQSQAEEVLDDFAAAVVAGYQKKSLKKSFWMGILEAMLGAFGYTIVLIVLSIFAHRFGIDIFHYYESLAGS